MDHFHQSNNPFRRLGVPSYNNLRKGHPPQWKVQLWDDRLSIWQTYLVTLVVSTQPIPAPQKKCYSSQIGISPSRGWILFCWNHQLAIVKLGLQVGDAQTWKWFVSSGLAMIAMIAMLDGDFGGLLKPKQCTMKGEHPQKNTMLVWSREFDDPCYFSKVLGDTKNNKVSLVVSFAGLTRRSQRGFLTHPEESCGEWRGTTNSCSWYIRGGKFLPAGYNTRFVQS